MRRRKTCRPSGAGKNVAWKKEVPGKGWSSPSLSLGRIYLTSAVPVEEGGKQRR
jgi:hypothetical protein